MANFSHNCRRRPAGIGLAGEKGFAIYPEPRNKNKISCYKIQGAMVHPIGRPPDGGAGPCKPCSEIQFLELKNVSTIL